MEKNFIKKGFMRMNQQQIPYGYYPPSQMSYLRQPMPQMTLKGRPVSSFDEVKASPIDFDGTLFYFPDTANQRIYTKQIGMDGAPIFNMYELKEFTLTTEAPTPLTNYVTKDELEQALLALKQSLTPPPVVKEEGPISFNF